MRINLSSKVEKLQSVEFPQNDKAFVETLVALASVADLMNKWTNKSWGAKNFGWSRHSGTTTAHK